MYPTTEKEAMSVINIPKWVCATDARKRDAHNKESYSDLEIAHADALFELAQLTYSRSRVFLNFRKKFIAIKVDSPSYLDKLSKNADKFTALMDQAGIETIKTRHGSIVYRIQRSVL